VISAPNPAANRTLCDKAAQRRSRPFSRLQEKGGTPVRVVSIVIDRIESQMLCPFVALG
jgi:hypothetical protein